MAMNGMAEAAQDELVTRYFEQAVAQGMNPMAALELAQRAASDTLGPLRPAATSEEIYGTASPAERMAAPRLTIADAAPPMRRPAPMATPRPAPMPAPRAMVTSGDDFVVRPYVRRTTPEELAAMMEPMAMVTSGGGTVRPYVRRNTPAEAAALMETAALPMVSSGDDFAVRPYVRSNTPEEVAALMETAAAYEEPRVVRSPGVYDMAPDMMRDRALEEAAARAFSAPPPPPVTLERSSLADSLLRALGLR